MIQNVDETNQQAIHQSELSKQWQCLELHPGEVSGCPRKNRGHRRVPGQGYLIRSGHSNYFGVKGQEQNDISTYVSITKYQILNFTNSSEVNSIHLNSSFYVCVLEGTHFEFAATFRHAVKIVVEAERLFTSWCLLLNRNSAQQFHSAKLCTVHAPLYLLLI